MANIRSSLLNTSRFCTQHHAKVPTVDVGHDIVLPGGLHRRWICTACNESNLKKLANLFGVQDAQGIL